MSKAFNAKLADLEQSFATNPPIRALNFHSTPREKAAQYDRQLQQMSEQFTSVNEAELESYLTTGLWHKPKPGLIVSVFEGYRNSFDVLNPLIEKHGFIGWYWVISGFINTPIPTQLNYADHHDIDMQTHEYPDARYAMTWAEIGHLDKKHVVACHTRSHMLLANMDAATRREEIVGSQNEFKKHLGHPVRSFVSLTGPPYGENTLTDPLIDEAKFDFVFSNFKIQRIRGTK